MPGAHVALCVRVHVHVALAPKEPAVLFIHDGFGVEDVMIYFAVRAEVEEVRRNDVKACWDWIFHYQLVALGCCVCVVTLE